MADRLIVGLGSLVLGLFLAAVVIMALDDGRACPAGESVGVTGYTTTYVQNKPRTSPVYGCVKD